MKIQVRIFVPILCLFLSATAFAHNGGGGGGFHGGGGGYNGGPVHNGGPINNGGNYHNGYNNNYHNHNNNGWYGGGVIIDNGSDDGTWFDDGVNDESTNVVIGVPDGGYYDPACQTVQTCNSDGECVTQQNCN